MAGGFRAWAFDLDVGDVALARLQPLLTADEVAHAGRFLDPREFGRYVAGRATLRQILGHCLGRAPSALRFAYSPFGKPALQADDDAPPLQFNASGSGELGIVAIHPTAAVGVDIERVRELADEADLARMLLSGTEFDEYSRLDPQVRIGRLLDSWTRKEALAKAEGSGLRQGLDRFRLHPWPGPDEFRVEGASKQLWVAPLAVPRTGFIAALASDRSVGRVQGDWWEDPRVP
jgi:4'-phosphopantetheinyl transferase